ncbi:hypothetical protein [Chitinophaga sancti]|uniref:Uncharacterized protein n=1 Tax=Chitinophaga sancti TaxID=1004 RepID=A0ABZ0XR15_9BACT|nr:hypothetical protein [Chitinophaga sancti]WQD61612.1 hypothetical protein U0033_27410 [Chitinophaga sancti]WQG92831.1 hypothetical protein SR876_15030 [Chitinophaga sancti]
MQRYVILAAFMGGGQVKSIGALGVTAIFPADKPQISRLLKEAG